MDKISNIQPLSKLIDKIAKNSYELKVLRNNQVKIQSKSTDIYRLIVKELKERNTKFFTYKVKQDRSFRVVLKNMHISFNIDKIRQTIEEQGHVVTNLWNLKLKS